MKHQVYLGIALRIIILFAVAMAATFVPEQLRDFFGDTSCEGKTYEWYGSTREGCPGSSFGIDEDWQWGARHYWYAWLMVFLFVLSVVNVVMSIVALLKKHYDIQL
jgi:hypothetical protein